jgi:DNA-binding MarR family transcriptional regulator
VAATLARVVGRITRHLRYRTRPMREALGVTDSEYDLLRLVRRRPGIRVQEAALELGVASNSVSTLIKQLGRAGLIDRASDPLDGRAACLRLTERADAELSEVAGVREAAIVWALDSLEQADRTSIEAALPALSRLSEALLSVGESLGPRRQAMPLVESMHGSDA